MSISKMFADIAIVRADPNFRKDVFRDEWDEVIVDTCYAADQGQWETGVKRGDDTWDIAEQYDSREEAEVGHAKWIAALKADPDMSITNLIEY